MNRYQNVFINIMQTKPFNVKMYQAEPEFVDDYERPELEKYEKYTPTPKDKRPSESQVKKCFKIKIIF